MLSNTRPGKERRVMPKLNEYMAVGFCSGYGDADFRVSCNAASLNPKQVKELREIIPVAIAQLEKYLTEAMKKTVQSGETQEEGRG